jgi:hypothetical protein
LGDKGFGLFFLTILYIAKDLKTKQHLRVIRWGMSNRNSLKRPFAGKKKALASLDVKAFLTGGQGRNRTTDTRIFSPLLYRLSYLAEANNYS